MTEFTSRSNQEYIFCRYIVRNGKRIYPKRSRFFRFPKPKNDSSIKPVV